MLLPVFSKIGERARTVGGKEKVRKQGETDTEIFLFYLMNILDTLI